MGGVVSSVVGGIGGIISGGAASRAAESAAAAQRDAANRASQMAQFRPVGITTGFGSSRFKVNELGQVEEAGYELTPELQAIRDRLLSQAGAQTPEALGQAAQPLMGGAASLFGLGQGYLAESPEAARQQFMQQQQGLLAPAREQQLATIRNRLAQTGRTGLAVGGTQAGGRQAANPELQAYYNALAQQDAEIAARAQQAAMEQQRFGAGLFATGGELLGQVPRLTSAGYGPLQTQLGLAQTVEGLGQQPFLLSQDLARAQAGAGAQAGGMYQTGMQAAIANQQRADAYSPLGSFLSGGGSGAIGSLFSGFGGGGLPVSSSTGYSTGMGGFSNNPLFQLPGSR